MTRFVANTPASFWARVDCAGNCWQWLGNLNAKGYGYLSWARKRQLAHRLAYELLRCPIPDGLTIDHLCRNRACVNPAHMEPVTIRENILRGVSQPAINIRKTHCVRGHEFTPENTVPQGTGRRCLACRKAQWAAYSPIRIAQRRAERGIAV